MRKGIFAIGLAAIRLFATVVLTLAQTTPSLPIPGSVVLNAGQSATFASGSQSLTVTNQLPTNATIGLSASVSYDGRTLTLDSTSHNSSSINVVTSGANCAQVNNVHSLVSCVTSGGQITFQVAGPNPGGPCNTEPLPAGWSLVPGAVAQTINANSGPLYTFRAGDSAYETAQPSPQLPASSGYWVNFSQPTTVSLGCFIGPPNPSSAQPVTLTVGAGWTMVGNPFIGAAATMALVSGADAVDTYAPNQGYQATPVLNVGQGAWVYSASGATITLSPTSGIATLSNCSNTVSPETLSNNNQMLTLHVGDCFLLNLGSSYNWTVNVDNTSVLSRVANVSVTQGAQGIYAALNTGTAKLTATGNPAYLQSQPPCAVASLLFQISVTVQS